MNTFLTSLVRMDHSVLFAAHLVAGILSLGLVLHSTGLPKNSVPSSGLSAPQIEVRVNAPAPMIVAGGPSDR